MKGVACTKMASRYYAAQRQEETSGFFLWGGVFATIKKM